MLDAAGSRRLPRTRRWPASAWMNHTGRSAAPSSRRCWRCWARACARRRGARPAVRRPARSCTSSPRCYGTGGSTQAIACWIEQDSERHIASASPASAGRRHRTRSARRCPGRRPDPARHRAGRPDRARREAARAGHRGRRRRPAPASVRRCAGDRVLGRRGATAGHLRRSLRPRVLAGDEHLERGHAHARQRLPAGRDAPRARSGALGGGGAAAAARRDGPPAARRPSGRSASTPTACCWSPPPTGPSTGQ